jgi:hypothetical protein
MMEGAKSELKAVHNAVDIKYYKEDFNMARDNCSGIM